MSEYRAMGFMTGRRHVAVIFFLLRSTYVVDIKPNFVDETHQ